MSNRCPLDQRLPAEERASQQRWSNTEAKHRLHQLSNRSKTRFAAPARKGCQTGAAALTGLLSLSAIKPQSEATPGLPDPEPASMRATAVEAVRCSEWLCASSASVFVTER